MTDESSQNRFIHQARTRYTAAVERLCLLGFIDSRKRKFLLDAIANNLGQQAQSVCRPSACGLVKGDDQIQRAVGAGLVTDSGKGHYYVRCGPETVHWGYLSAASQPILRVNPGDVVTIDTISHEGILADQGDPVAFFARAGVRKDDVLADVVEIYTRVQHNGAGPHVITGPIAVAGAEPGDVLAVDVLDVQCRVPYGVNATRTGRGGLPSEFTLNRSVVISFDLERNLANFAPGVEVPLAPFFGIMATAPAPSLGALSSIPPGPYGGNIDLKDLTGGSTLYLPVHVPEALFMVGDGHAAQGDGEVNLTAIETSLTGTFRFELIKGRPITWPRAETSSHWIILGLHDQLDEAMRIAIREVVKFLHEEKDLSEADAYALASIAVDFEVTQFVNQTKGIHGLIPKAIFRDQTD